MNDRSRRYQKYSKIKDPADKKKKKWNPGKLGGIFLLILFSTVLIVFILVQLLNPKSLFIASSGETAARLDTNEVPLCEKLKCEHWETPHKRVVLTVSMYAKTNDESRDQLDKLIKRHMSEINDEIRSVVSGLKYWDVRDPKLLAVRSTIKQRATQIIGKPYIEDIFIPVWNANVQ